MRSSGAGTSVAASAALTAVRLQHRLASQLSRAATSTILLEIQSNSLTKFVNSRFFGTSKHTLLCSPCLVHPERMCERTSKSLWIDARTCIHYRSELVAGNGKISLEVISLRVPLFCTSLGKPASPIDGRSMRLAISCEASSKIITVTSVCSHKEYLDKTVLNGSKIATVISGRAHTVRLLKGVQF